MSKDLQLFDFNRYTPYAVGFDSLFTDLLRYATNQAQSTGYPPYNVRKEGNKYFIDVALAGTDKDQIEVQVEDQTLTIRSLPKNAPNDTRTSYQMLYQGISFRQFTRSFTLEQNIEVISATFTNGMLSIQLERVVPEEKKARLITIK